MSGARGAQTKRATHYCGSLGSVVASGGEWEEEDHSSRPLIHRYADINADLFLGPLAGFTGSAAGPLDLVRALSLSSPYACCFAQQYFSSRGAILLEESQPDCGRRCGEAASVEASQSAPRTAAAKATHKKSGPSLGAARQRSLARRQSGRRRNFPPGRWRVCRATLIPVSYVAD